jgi:hypothetical protein
VERKRRLFVVLVALLSLTSGTIYEAVQTKQANDQAAVQSASTVQTVPGQTLASEALKKLEVKGRAPKTGYTRAQFGDGWNSIPGCDVRNYILKRDMTNVVTVSDTDCRVVSGILQDPYTDKTIQFKRGQDTSDDVQIDHVVALSDAWQKGAQQLSREQRITLANDSLNLLAVEGKANQDKSDADAATWLPPNKPYRCRYVARQIAVKIKYTLWVTSAERNAMQDVLKTCPDQILPIVN